MKFNYFAAAGVIAVIAVSASTPLYADFTYTETTQITGGSIVGMMKMASAFSKQARQSGDPVVSTVIVKGNRMTRIGQDRTEIIDLDKGTVTQIDMVKHQYTVMTFEQMKQQMDAAAQRAKQRQAKSAPDQSSNTDVKFQVHVRNTNATRDVAGLSAKESIMTMSMDATNTTSGQTGSLGITNDMWLTPEIPGYNEVRDFYARYAARMGTVFGGMGGMSAMLATHPGATQGMADMAKEVSKLKGVPVLQVTRMGNTVNGVPIPAASEAPLPASNSPATPSAGEVGQQAATSAIASSLGLGGLGFGRKKKADAAPADQSQGAPGTATVLMESNTQLSSFSQAPVDSAKFDVPAGFKQIEVKNLD